MYCATDALLHGADGPFHLRRMVISIGNVQTCWQHVVCNAGKFLVCVDVWDFETLCFVQECNCLGLSK